MAGSPGKLHFVRVALVVQGAQPPSQLGRQGVRVSFSGMRQRLDIALDLLNLLAPRRLAMQSRDLRSVHKTRQISLCRVVEARHHHILRRGYVLRRQRRPELLLLRHRHRERITHNSVADHVAACVQVSERKHVSNAHNLISRHIPSCAKV